MSKLSKSILRLSLLGGCALIMSACSNTTQRSHHVTHHIATYKVAHTKNKKQANKAYQAQFINYKKPSEQKPYPTQLTAKSNRILVSIKAQRAYIQVHQHNQWNTIYTMYASTGSHNRTPKCKFHINGVKTKWFYSPQEREGAQYGTGWHDGGVYLFHATPANAHHQIYKNVAKQLGKKPSSHGCVHLTIPDAKYIYSHAPQGMPIIIY